MVVTAKPDHLKLVVLLVSSFLCLFACRNKFDNSPVNPAPAPVLSAFLSLNGKHIVDAQQHAVYLRGVAFGNEVWSNTEIPDKHHNETDYSRVAAMGMNVIRFYMNYRTFEDDNNPYHYKQSGWDWLDLNVTWAKNHNIRLILNMHVPQGGYQSQGQGDSLWIIPSNQNRLVALWKAIASRYAREPQIAGFGLVNEPVPTNSKLQWQQLAQQISDAIRSADTSHLLFIERANWVKGAAGEDPDLNFPQINDSKTVYEFHCYSPLEYTHQLFDWAGFGDGGNYPDDSILTYMDAVWYTATFNNPSLGAGTHGWQFFTGVKYHIDDPKISIGIPAMVGADVGGTVWFDQALIREYDPEGNFTRVIMQIDPLTCSGWSYWSQNNSGNWGLSDQTGAGDLFSLYISGSTGDCNISNYNTPFVPKQGYFYQINGSMKGENVAAGSGCRFRIDFLTSDEPVYDRNKEYLEAMIKKYTDWAMSKNVPLFMGEFGAGIHCFQNGKGGLNWVNDMIDIGISSELNFTYHCYHEDSFGLYYGSGSLPDPSRSNQPLIGLLTQKLH